MNITYTNEVSPYVVDLASLSLNRYERYDLEVGDTVEIECDFNGISIPQGVVHAILEPTEELSKIIANEDDLYEYTEEEKDYIDRNFDHHNFWAGGRADTPCIVSFKKYVSEVVLLKKFNLNSIPPGESELKWKGLAATIKLDKKDIYVLTLFQTAFIGGRSVISTKEIDKLKHHHSRSRQVEGVAYSDNAIDPGTIERINFELDRFCGVQKPDYHPGSGNVVRDIIHPSLYCYVKRSRGGGIDEINTDSGNVLSGRAESKDFWGRQYDDSIYQWLPSEIDVSKDGKIKILSYINNLDEKKFPGLMGVLVDILESVLPLLELACGSLRNDYEGSSEGGVHSVPLRGRRLQIITKVVEYAVSSEQNFDGVWHVEGMSHEEIIATALCIVKRDVNFEGAEIEFRRFLYEKEAEELVFSSGQGGQKSTDMMDGGDVRPLGSLETPAGRVIVFPNSHIHRLTNMSSVDGGVAKRRIVVFWLVNPDRRIISTQDIPPQQDVITIEEALRNRLALMAERKLHKQNFSEREVELCEH